MLFRVASASMGGGDPAVLERHLEQLVHIPRTEHVAVEEDETLHGDKTASGKRE